MICIIFYYRNTDGYLSFNQLLSFISVTKNTWNDIITIHSNFARLLYPLNHYRDIFNRKMNILKIKKYLEENHKFPSEGCFNLITQNMHGKPPSYKYNYYSEANITINNLLFIMLRKYSENHSQRFSYDLKYLLSCKDDEIVDSIDKYHHNIKHHEYCTKQYSSFFSSTVKNKKILKTETDRKYSSASAHSSLGRSLTLRSVKESIKEENNAKSMKFDYYM